MDAARHYATAITLLRGADAGPAVDPATLVGMDVPSLVELNDVRRLCCPSHCAVQTPIGTLLPECTANGMLGWHLHARWTCITMVFGWINRLAWWDAGRAGLFLAR